MTDLVLSGLMARRAELLKEARAAEAAYHRLVEDIGHLDGAIRVLDRTYRPYPLRKRQLPHHGRGVLAVLRDATGPMLVTDIARLVLAKRGQDTHDPKMLRRMIAQTRTALSRYRRTGTARATPGNGTTMLWEVAR